MLVKNGGWSWSGESVTLSTNKRSVGRWVGCAVSQQNCQTLIAIYTFNTGKLLIKHLKMMVSAISGEFQKMQSHFGLKWVDWKQPQSQILVNPIFIKVFLWTHGLVENIWSNLQSLTVQSIDPSDPFIRSIRSIRSIWSKWSIRSILSIWTPSDPSGPSNPSDPADPSDPSDPYDQCDPIDSTSKIIGTNWLYLKPL